MAKPDLENGYLQIAHELFSALLCAGFTKWEQVVIREVLNQIFGPRKSKTATLSPTEIARQVSTHKESIVRATRTLIASNVLTKIGDMEYRFLKDYEAWTRDGEPRLSTFERAYCESAKTINVSNKDGNNSAPDASTECGNNGAPISTKDGNNGAPASMDCGNNGAPVREQWRSPTGAPALPCTYPPPDPPKAGAGGRPLRIMNKAGEGLRPAEAEAEAATETASEFGEKNRQDWREALNVLRSRGDTSIIADQIEATRDPSITNLDGWRALVASYAVQKQGRYKTFKCWVGCAIKANAGDLEAIEGKSRHKPLPGTNGSLNNGHCLTPSERLAAQVKACPPPDPSQLRKALANLEAIPKPKPWEITEAAMIREALTKSERANP